MPHHTAPAHRAAPTPRRAGASLLAAALAAGTLALDAPPAVAAPASSEGYVVLIGGAVVPDDPTSEAIMQRIVKLAQEHAGPGQTPLIAVSTAASSVATSEAEASDPAADNATANGVIYYTEWFEKHGAEVYPIPVDLNPGEDYPGDPYSADNARDAEVAAEIAKADAVYFGGGDQTNYVRAFFDCTAPDEESAAIHAYTSCTDTVAMEAIRSVVESGGVSAGTSAGLAIQQGADMISGGEPYQAWRDGAVPGWFDGSDPVTGSLLSYIPAGGFGFFEEGTLDSHFARRDRQPRVVRLAIQTGHERAFGVEENTALVVDRAARTGTVIGELGASMLDVSQATSDGVNVAGVRYSYFMTGSTIDFSTGEITLAQTPNSGPGTGEAPVPEEDIWKSYECDSDPFIFGALTLAQTFVKSAEARASGDSCDAEIEQPRFRTTYNRLDETLWTEDGSFVDLGMTISAIPSFEASAALADAESGTDLPVGSTAEVAVTVTNTGGTWLTGLSVDGGEPDQRVLAPGESLTLALQHTVALGEQTVDAEITATAIDSNGADLSITTDPAAVSLTITGTQPDPGPDPEDPDENDDPDGNDDPKNGENDVANTGSTAPFGLWTAGTLLAAAGAALLLARSRGRTS